MYSSPGKLVPHKDLFEKLKRYKMNLRSSHCTAMSCCTELAVKPGSKFYIRGYLIDLAGTGFRIDFCYITVTILPLVCLNKR